MATKTKIDWADLVWNPAHGCSLVSEGCFNCYARRIAEGRLRGRGGYPQENPFKLVVQEEKMFQTFGKKPKRIFVNSMFDFLHEYFFTISTNDTIPYIHHLMHILDTICDEKNEHHTFIILTKRPQNWRKLMCYAGDIWPGDSALNLTMEVFGRIPNLWVGVSVENQKRADERIPILLNEIKEPAIRFICCEPLLEEINLEKWMDSKTIDWVIAGGETGHKARECDPDWVFKIWEDCHYAKIPFFFKSWGDRIKWENDLPHPLWEDIEKTREFPIKEKEIN